MNNDLEIAIEALEKKFPKGAHNKKYIDRILFAASKIGKSATSKIDCQFHANVVQGDLNAKRNEFDQEAIMLIEQLIEAIEAYAILLELAEV